MIRRNIIIVSHTISVLLLALAGLTLSVSPLAAQNPPPKDEIFGGYSVLFPNGWEEPNYKANTIPDAFSVSNTYYLPKAHNLYFVPAGDLCGGHSELGTPVDESAVKGQQRGKLPPKIKAAAKP